MFDFPLPRSKYTFYDQLGIAPEATVEEIRSAKIEIKERIAARQKLVTERIQSILDQARKRRPSSKEGDATSPDPVEVEELAAQIDPEYDSLTKQVEDLSNQLNEINKINIEAAEIRLEYDGQNPPCALLKLAVPEKNVFLDKRRALFLLRRELSAFLSADGEPVFHPSDLTREDFSSDFMFIPELDGGRK